MGFYIVTEFKTVFGGTELGRKKSSKRLISSREEWDEWTYVGQRYFYVDDNFNYTNRLVRRKKRLFNIDDGDDEVPFDDYYP